ncbi:MAG: DUF4388 domain-containing protein [Acidimicrobiia bacterium]|nr:DUF4388 domain-containing protein [Acidimicrobiia bacterium]
MSLKGTLETFPLGEVIALVGRTAKTGALRVTSRGGSGTLFFVEGSLCGTQDPDAADAPADRTDFEGRLLDLCFSLNRLGDGGFEFESGVQPPWPAEHRVPTAAVMDLVATVEQEWPAVQAVIPSGECGLRLAERLRVDEVTIDAAGWCILRAVDGRRTVRQIARDLRYGLVATSRTLRPLVESGMVEIVPPRALDNVGRGRDGEAPGPEPGEPPPSDPPPLAATGPDGGSRPALRVVPADHDGSPGGWSGPEGAGEHDEVDPSIGEERDLAAVAAENAEAARDRGALLRLFSALRDV